MVKFLIKRILMVIPVMLGVTTIIFALRAITPGDPIEQLLPVATSTEEQRDALRADLGLDKPLVLQYFYYLKGVATGDFGKSFQTRQPITKELMVRLPVSLPLRQSRPARLPLPSMCRLCAMSCAVRVHIWASKQNF